MAFRCLSPARRDTKGGGYEYFGTGIYRDPIDFGAVAKYDRPHQTQLFQENGRALDFTV